MSMLSCSDTVEYSPVVYKDVTFELNDGEKWNVPTEMSVYMDSSFLVLDEVKDGEPISEKTIESLIRYKGLFVSNCGMEGKGHDVLHSWLIPYMDLLETVSEAKSHDDKMQTKAELIEAKRIYKEYFN